MVTVKTTVIGADVVRAKLLLAEPRILAQNRSLVQAMLEQVSPVVKEATPLGPAHFGYHGRDTLRIEVSSKGSVTRGVLRAGVQMYWREFGTRDHFHKGNTRLSYAHALGMFGGGGEKAHLTATKALNATRRFIRFYYNGMANWWRS